MSPNGYTLSDHMTLASVVATILILDNTAQVCVEPQAILPIDQTIDIRAQFCS